MFIRHLRLFSLVLVVSASGCTLKFSPLKNCINDEECFRNEVCVMQEDSIGRCVSTAAQDMGAPPSNSSPTDEAMNELDGGSSGSVDTSLRTGVGTSNEDTTITQLPTPLVRWQFDVNDPSALLSTGEIEGLTFMLNGGASLDVNGLNLMPQPADAVSTNAFLTGDTTALFERLTQSNTFSIRLWVWTKHPLQDGPARIFTWSQDSALRNLTIGQVSVGKVQGRVRFDNGFTNDNGFVPSEESLIVTTDGSLTSERGFQQVVMQYDALGTLELWVDDDPFERPCLVDDMIGGFSTWDSSFAIALGDELFNAQPRIDTAESANHNRPWRGVIHSLEIYADPVEPSQVRTWLAEKPTFQDIYTESVDFTCPTADSTPWTVTSCEVNRADGVRFCEYFVSSGSDTLGSGPTCRQFCETLNLRTCDASEECCWNNGPDPNSTEPTCERGLVCDYDPNGEQGFRDQICRCFEAVSETP